MESFFLGAPVTARPELPDRISALLAPCFRFGLGGHSTERKIRQLRFDFCEPHDRIALHNRMPPVIDPVRDHVVLLLLILLASLAVAVNFILATFPSLAVAAVAPTSPTLASLRLALTDLASTYRRCTEHKRRIGQREKAEREGFNGWTGIAGDE